MSSWLSQNKEQQELLSVAQTFVPLSALKFNYLAYLLLSRSTVEHVCSGETFIHRGVSDYRHIYLLNGVVSLSYASGYKKLLNAQDNITALVNEMPRPCDVVTESDCAFLVMESEFLDRILSWSQISQYLLSELAMRRDLDEDIEWIQTMLNSNLFYKVPPVNAHQVLGRMKSQTVEEGEVIVRQGEIGSCCYFIKEGEADITRYDNKQHIHLAEVGKGRCFGEDALVYETVRNATVKMLTDGVLMRLEKKDFKLLLIEPDVEEIDGEDTKYFSEPPVYIDVRTIEEYDDGHLLMSVCMPLSLLSINMRLLNKSVPYVLYCDTGRRSRSAAYLLGKQGFQTASIRGGLLGAEMQYQLIQNSSYILKGGRVVKAENT